MNPKYKVGDIITNDIYKYRITKVSGDFYHITNIDTSTENINVIEFIDKMKHIRLVTTEPITLTVQQIQQSCSHSKKYHNIISRTLQFWYCPDCKQEV
jgi:hypothetical protein